VAGNVDNKFRQLGGVLKTMAPIDVT
jgi:hypothetical protein